MSQTAIKFSSRMKVLVFGSGYTGRFFAKDLRASGVNVLCSRTDAKSPGADFVFDSNKNKLPDDSILDGVTHVLSCIPPSENEGDPVLNLLKDKLDKLPIEWTGYLSTTGVYGNTKGEWVDEQFSPKPLQKRSIRRLRCEQQWQESGLPNQIFRLPGIYGPGRSAIDTILKKKVILINKKDQVFSRIYVEDISQALIHIISLSSQQDIPKIINISDNKPSSQIEVISYAAKLLQKGLPEPIDFNEAKESLSPIALSFWEENRRVSNSLLCKKLGYRLRYPDYKSGINKCFDINKIKKRNHNIG